MCKWLGGWRGVPGRRRAAAAGPHIEGMQLQSTGDNKGDSGKRATYTTYTPRKHVWAKPPRAAPKLRMAPHTPLQRATALLWPHGIDDYPGPRYGLYHLFKGRAAIYTIRDWRRGRRRLPQWARDILIAELEKRAEALTQAARELQNESMR